MRTTLDIDADVLDMARYLADTKRISIGKALSDLARRNSSAVADQSESRNGIALFRPTPGHVITDDLVAAELENLEVADSAYAKYFSHLGGPKSPPKS